MSHATPIVFVVDDDVSVRESLELLIRCAGWQPETFASAQEFLCRPRVLAPELPGARRYSSGPQRSRSAEAHCRDRTDMPIIFITGHGDVPMTVQAMKAGAVEFLTKPFSDDVLLNAIRQRHRAQPRPPCATRRRCGRCGAAYASLSRREREVMALVVSGSVEQAGRWRTRHQRDHGEGAPGQGDAEDEGRLSCRPGEHGRETTPRIHSERMTGLTLITIRRRRTSRIPIFPKSAGICTCHFDRLQVFRAS